ncbi:hypothetical protein XPA_006229 [Xanthoria parietina]
MAAVLEASDQGRIIINGVHNAPLIKDANIPPPLPPQQDQPPSIDPHDHGASSQKRKGESASPPPPSAWTPRCHPRSAQVGPTVERYFLDNWPFPTPRARARFLTAGFSTVTCLYFPLARDDRIEYACRLLTLLFLIDGEGEPPPLFFFPSASSFFLAFFSSPEIYCSHPSPPPLFFFNTRAASLLFLLTLALFFGQRPTGRHVARGRPSVQCAAHAHHAGRRAP